MRCPLGNCSSEMMMFVADIQLHIQVSKIQNRFAAIQMLYQRRKVRYVVMEQARFMCIFERP